MTRFEEIEELLEVAYIGMNAARDEDEVRHWEGQIEELEAERDEILRKEFREYKFADYATDVEPLY